MRYSQFITVIFLDIDGVLVNRKMLQLPIVTADLKTGQRFKDPHEWYHQLDPDCIARLNRLTTATGAKLVISSTWRLGTEAEFWRTKAYFYSAGIKADIIGRTPSIVRVLPNGCSRGVERGDEIDEWLNDNGTVEKFIILDDNSDMGDHLDHLVQTDTEKGLQDEDVEDALKLLEEMVV